MKALVPLFKGASQLEVTAALRHFRPAKVDMNIPLMEEGDEDPSLIVVLDGELEVRCGPVELATARTGDLVGEVSLFTGARRTAAVRTLSPCKLLTLDRSGYEALAAAQNTVAYSLELDALAQLTRRLRRMLSLLVHLQGTGIEDATRPPPRAEDASHAGAGSLLDALTRSPFFAGASADALREVSTSFITRTVPEPTTVIESGQPAETLVLPLEGVWDAYPASGRRDVPTADAPPGVLLDVAAMFDHQPSPFTWRTRGAASFACMGRPQWKTLVEGTHPAGSAIRVAAIRSLVDRIAPLTERVLQMEQSRRDQIRAEIADFLGKESDELPESQFSHYGFGGQRSG